MVDLWWAEAGRYGVLPLDDRTLELFVGSRSKPGSIVSKRHFVYYPPINHVPQDACPLGVTGGLPWILDVEIKRANDTDEGVLVAIGTMNGGRTFYIKDSHLVCDLNMLMDHHVVRSDIAVPTGESTVRVHFRRKGRRGTLTLSINGKECGSILLPYFLFVLSSSGLDIGQDSLSPVTNDYEAPFKFSGVIHRVVIDLPKFKSLRKGKAEKRKEAEVNHRVEMSKQ